MLILVPTASELNILQPYLDGARVELCGFGPIVSAARTANFVARSRPRQVVLVGIAGTYESRLSLGSAYEFGSVACYGIGVGSGDDHRTASQVGWPQWPGTPHEPAIGDIVSLAGHHDKLLISNCSCSSTPAEAARCLATYPTGQAEDMEGFGVAAACLQNGVPLKIVRGISNVAGDRDKSNWQIRPALEAAGRLVQSILKNSPTGGE